MKAVKHFEDNKVIVYLEEGDNKTCIVFNDEQQMRRMGICLQDLARIGGRKVEIN